MHNIMHSIFWVAGAIIASLESTMYEVNETDLSLIICAIQVASIERDVVVAFLIESQSALRKYCLTCMLTTVQAHFVLYSLCSRT